MPVAGNLAQLAQLAGRLEKLGREAKRTLSRELAHEARALVAESFQKGQAPDGTPWAPLKLRQGQPLRDTGRLASSITLVENGDGFTVGTNLVYAGIHQHGGVIRAKRAKQLFSKKLGIGFGKAVRIPARPFLPGAVLPERWRARLAEAAEDAIAALFPDDA